MTSEDIPLAYVYNKSRDIEFFMPFEAVDEWFVDELIIYVEAEYVDNPKYHDITITRKIEQQA